MDGVVQVVIDVIVLALILSMLFPFIFFVYDSVVWFFTDSDEPYGEIVMEMTNAYNNTYFVSVAKSFKSFLAIDYGDDEQVLPSPLPDYANLGKGYKNLFNIKFWEYWLGEFNGLINETF